MQGQRKFQEAVPEWGAAGHKQTGGAGMRFTTFLSYRLAGFGSRVHGIWPLLCNRHLSIPWTDAMHLWGRSLDDLDVWPSDSFSSAACVTSLSLGLLVNTLWLRRSASCLEPMTAFVLCASCVSIIRTGCLHLDGPGH